MLSLDIETYSEVNLSKSGVYAYAESPTFQVLLLAFAFDEEPVQVIDLLSGEPLPARVKDALLSDQVPKTAFNAAFERVCLSKHLGVPLSPLSWHCTAVQAAMLALPQSLEGVGEVLNIKRKKLKEGSDLVRYFCIPCKPTKVNGGRRRNLPQHAPDKWSIFKAYCQRDVEAEREIRQRLAKHPVSEQEQALYCLDQEINDRGILVDPVLVQEAIRIDKRFQEEASAKAYALTGLHNPNSVSQMKEWLSGQGVTTGSLDKKAVSSLIQESAGEVLEMLKLRLLMAKTSVRKYEAIQRSVCADGRVHGLLQFYGANRTGRWAGRLVQVQNLPANHMPDLDSARQFVRQGQYEALDILYPSIPNVLSELIRTAFIPKPGSRFIVADFSAIEARVIAWLAGESWRLEVFQTHGKIYEASASAMFGVAIDEITKGSPLRQKGKVAELACIAEGSLALTDQGLVPIQQVTTHMKLWDGGDWVSHEGVIDQGIKQVMTYDGLCATADHLVYLKAVLAQERMEETQKEFTDENWQKALEHDRSGSVKDTLDNIVHILRYDPRLQGLAFDLHRDGIVARSHLPWEQIKEGWGDSDFASMKVYLNNTYGIYAPQKTKDAYVAVASERKFHPIKEFLSSLPAWDRVKRVDHLLVDFFGAENNAYTRAVMRKTLVAAVARVYRPGTKFDSVLILNGPQGIGKSTFFAKLAGNWFSDSLTLTEMRDKAGPEKLQGYWILELGELAGMRKADVETVKSFLSRTDDKYRASYGLNVESHPRQCVIVGSTNSESGFLRDITGNRRFWPVSVEGSGTRKPWELTKDEVEQIWAEALCMYKAGEKMFLEGDEAIMAQSQQAEAMETDDREGLIREYLEKLLPANWESMPLYDRRSFLGGHDFGGTLLTGTEQRQFVCNMEIWAECFSKDPAVMKKSDSYEISGIMNKIEGWRGPRTSDDRQVFGIYGRQRCYSRVPGQDGQAHTLSQDACPIKTPVLT